MKPRSAIAPISHEHKRVYDVSILERLNVIRLAIMKSVLTKLDGCRCATLEDCGRIFETALGRYRASQLRRGSLRA